MLDTHGLLSTMADHCGLSYAQRDRKLVLLCLRASVTDVDGYVGRAHALSHHAHHEEPHYQ